MCGCELCTNVVDIGHARSSVRGYVDRMDGYKGVQALINMTHVNVMNMLLTHLQRTTGRQHTAHHRQKKTEVMLGKTDGECFCDVLHSSAR